MKKVVIILLGAFVIIWAFSAKDTVSIVPSAGAFSLAVKPANCKLYVEAVKPYKDVTVTNIIVEEAKYTDVGEIKLTSDQH
jgi:hypothetical protein